MKLNEVIARLVELERSVAVEEPRLAVKAAYPYFPPGKDAIELPCFMNQWAFVSETRRPNNQRELRYIIRPQLLVGDAEIEPHLKAEEATLLHDAFLSVLDADVMLGDGSLFSRVRGVEGTFQPLELDWHGVSYVGLQYLIDVTINDVSRFGT